MSKLYVIDSILKYIKNFEGWRAKAYKCPANVWTIGWGSTKWFDGGPILSHFTVTKDEGHKLFKRDIDGFAESVEKRVEVPLTNNQFGALVSFAYNVGMGNFVGSTLLKKLNKRYYNSAADEFLRWVYARDRETNKWIKLSGLVSRRKMEKKIFLSPDEFDHKKFAMLVNNLKARGFAFIHRKKFTMMNLN